MGVRGTDWGVAGVAGVAGVEGVVGIAVAGVEGVVGIAVEAAGEAFSLGVLRGDFPVTIISK